MTTVKGPRLPFTLVPATIALLAALNLSIPYFALAPGPAEDVNRLLAISGTRTYPNDDKLLLTTVSLRNVTVVDAIVGALDPVIAIVPREAILPPRTSDREQDRVNARQMRDSKVAAAAAALNYLGIPGVQLTGEGARVETVFERTPAADTLRKGDLIVGVDDDPVRTTTDLTSIIQKPKPGTRFSLTVQRGGERLDIAIRTIGSPDDPKRPIIGVQVVTIGERIDFPFKIDIRSGGIGGPSAGLMFALAIVDRLQDGDLASGHNVAGTGVISVEGEVGEVGGVVQKVAAAERAGADVFLVPRGELRDARRAARHIQVVGVSTLAEAVDALRALQRPVSAAGGRKN